MISKKFSIGLAAFLLLALSQGAFAFEAYIISGKKGEVAIREPEVTKYFHDELKGEARRYSFELAEPANIYVNLFVPLGSNARGKYSLRMLSGDKEVAFLDGTTTAWKEWYDARFREHYNRGPSFEGRIEAGSYIIEVFSSENSGKYILQVGNNDRYQLPQLLNFYWQIPVLKLGFFQTPITEFFFTAFFLAAVAILGVLLILILFVRYIVSAVKEAIKHRDAKTLLLTSSAPEMKDEIIKLLQKPSYDVNVAFVPTAAKGEEDASYAEADRKMLIDMGFNVEVVDIDGKTEAQLMEAFQVKDIIFVEGGNTFYLLQAMRKSNFEKVIRKLLKEGIVYIGVSAGSIVAGRTIQTAGWKGFDKNNVGIKNLRGLNLVPFDIFVHYRPEHAEIIKKEMPKQKKRAKNLRILTDGQAVLVQGKEDYLLGDGEQIVV